MREAILIVLMMGLIIACWALVIGHQINAFDPDQFEVLQGFTAFAYVGAGLSVCGVAILALSFLKR